MIVTQTVLQRALAQALLIAARKADEERTAGFDLDARATKQIDTVHRAASLEDWGDVLAGLLCAAVVSAEVYLAAYQHFAWALAAARGCTDEPANGASPDVTATNGSVPLPWRMDVRRWRSPHGSARVNEVGQLRITLAESLGRNRSVTLPLVVGRCSRGE